MSDKILMCIINDIHTPFSIWKSVDVRKEKDFIIQSAVRYMVAANRDKLIRLVLLSPI